MGVRTPEEYIKSLVDGRVVYFKGEKIPDVTKHWALKTTIDMCTVEYALANDPRYQDLFQETTDEGERTCFVYIPFISSQHLLRRRKILDTVSKTTLGRVGGVRNPGIDGLSALTVVSRRMDRQLGTDYGERVDAFRKYLQKHDLATALLMTDVKGDRSLRPSEQKSHQDYYLRIIEENADGIIIRGAKAHASWAPCANELILLPCRAMKEEDKDYAVACAVPANAKGVVMIEPERSISYQEENWADYPVSSGDYSSDAVVIFDNVFVPKERVFLTRSEWRFSSELVYMFANFHRLMANVGKYAEAEIIVGAAILAAECNGLERVSHIMNKIAWLIYYAEGFGALGQLACENCVVEPATKLVYPHPIYANMAKFFYADNFHQALKYVQDIAGGLASTVPSAEDFSNPETRPWLEKYLGGKAGIPTENRFRVMKLILDLSNAHKQIGAIQAEGSLQSQLLSIYALGDFERYKAAAKRAARVKDGKAHPIFGKLPDYPIR